MRKLFSIIVGISILWDYSYSHAGDRVQTEVSIIGTWKFTSYRYQGQELPIPNPDLDLRFTFDDNGYSNLKWFRYNEPGHCQRVAEFNLKMDYVLYQKTIWVDSENEFSCSSDPDMRLGTESFTNYDFDNGQLLLKLDLAGESFVYVKTKLP